MADENDPNRPDEPPERALAAAQPPAESRDPDGSPAAEAKPEEEPLPPHWEELAEAAPIFVAPISAELEGEQAEAPIPPIALTPAMSELSAAEAPPADAEPPHPSDAGAAATLAREPSADKDAPAAPAPATMAEAADPAAVAPTQGELDVAPAEAAGVAATPDQPEPAQSQTPLPATEIQVAQEAAVESTAPRTPPLEATPIAEATNDAATNDAAAETQREAPGEHAEAEAGGATASPAALPPMDAQPPALEQPAQIETRSVDVQPPEPLVSEDVPGEATAAIAAPTEAASTDVEISAAGPEPAEALIDPISSTPIVEPVADPVAAPSSDAEVSTERDLIEAEAALAADAALHAAPETVAPTSEPPTLEDTPAGAEAHDELAAHTQEAAPSEAVAQLEEMGDEAIAHAEEAGPPETNAQSDEAPAAALVETPGEQPANAEEAAQAVAQSPEAPALEVTESALQAHAALVVETAADITADASEEASELVEFPRDAEAPPAPASADLPPNYFRAAGDPEEPVEEPTTAWARARRALQQMREAAEPKFVAFFGAARGFSGGLLRRARGIRHPRSVRETAVWGGWAATALVTLVACFYFFVTWGMPSTDDLLEARNGQSITFLDRNGNVILREGAQNAPVVNLNSLPPYVAQAFIAIEDRRFYDHWGVDLEGMMRAGAQNIRAGRVVQGGSTITQQLAKNLFLTNERSWRRKAQEIAMAIWLETKFTKEEILALYLSRVYFGAGAYGIEAAAERYFDRPARELTLLQSAMIAGLVKAPSRLNPASQDMRAARERAEVVLAEMVALGFISDTERQAASQEELVVSRRNPAGVLSYYRDWIDPLLNEVIGTQRDDFVIETTIDIQAQRAGAEAVEAVLAEQGESRRVGQAALVSMDDEGGVIALVGGRDYDQSQFNRATQARRQPGSSFKYFIYLAAMENGLTPWSVRDDAPITIHIEGQPDWSPGNYHEEYNGPVELQRAFAQSYNMVAIRVANEVGGQHVIDVARRLGVASQLHNYHSLALGAQEVTLLEMTQAYGAMASEGYRVEAHGVLRIRRAHDDETMWSWRQQGGRVRVIEERPLRYMNYMMSRVVEAGTGTRARMPGRNVGGKTGTGNDYRDAWFVGFTPGIVTGVWVGNDNFTETARVTGGSLPADIWARFMPTAVRDVSIRALQMPGPDDYDVGAPNPAAPTLTAVGAPIGSGPAAANPVDAEDRSLDYGPEG